MTRTQQATPVLPSSEKCFRISEVVMSGRKLAVNRPAAGGQQSN